MEFWDKYGPTFQSEIKLCHLPTEVYRNLQYCLGRGVLPEEEDREILKKVISTEKIYYPQDPVAIRIFQEPHLRNEAVAGRGPKLDVRLIRAWRRKSAPDVLIRRGELYDGTSVIHVEDKDCWVIDPYYGDVNGKNPLVTNLLEDTMKKESYFYAICRGKILWEGVADSADEVVGKIREKCDLEGDVRISICQVIKTVETEVVIHD